MASTDVEMGGQTSCGEDVPEHAYQAAYNFAMTVAEECTKMVKKTRKPQKCADCQTKDAVARIRRPRSTSAKSKLKKPVNFQVCQNAKRTTLAFERLKKQLSEFAVKQITGILSEEEEETMSRLKQAIKDLDPAIQKILANRKARLEKRKRPVLEPIPEEGDEEGDRDEGPPPLEDPETTDLDDDLKPGTPSPEAIAFEDAYSGKTADIQDGPLMSFLTQKSESAVPVSLPTKFRAKGPSRVSSSRRR
jgi:hypothetical protein